MPLKRTGCWKANEMPRLARSVTERGVMSSPLKMSLPPVGVRMPAMILASVLLPLPLGPVIATKRSSIVRETSLKMRLFWPFSSTSKVIF